MKVTNNIENDITPQQLAAAFVNGGSDEQAEFFNLIGKCFKEAEFDAELQCCYIADDINKDGKDFLFTLSNFLKARGIGSDSKITTLLGVYETEILRG
jgi:hypothetical protein